MTNEQIGVFINYNPDEPKINGYWLEILRKDGVGFNSKSEAIELKKQILANQKLRMVLEE